MPICSVLVTTYNSERFIKYTLQSIFWQTFSDIEVLILDNNSQDKTKDIIKKIIGQDRRFTLIESTKNLGPFGGLNFLLEKSQSKYVAIIDHDDIWHPNKLQYQIDCLEENPSYIGCGSTFIDIREKQGFCKYELFTLFNVVMHSSLVFRNQGYRYNVSNKYADREFMTQTLGKHGHIFHISPALVLRRIRNEGGNTSVQLASLEGLFHSKKKYGVPRYEYLYNRFRFRYMLLYKISLYILRPHKTISLKKFVNTPLWEPYKEFVLDAFK